jgi:hypothetical protein
VKVMVVVEGSLVLEVAGAGSAGDFTLLYLGSLK